MAPPDGRGIFIDELMRLSGADLDALLHNDRPIVFQQGSGQILGRFAVVDGTLRVEVVQIDGAGERVMQAFAAGARNVAGLRSVKRIDWIVHAAACAAPNQRLQSVLDARDFVLEEVPGVGSAYRRVETFG